MAAEHLEQWEILDYASDHKPDVPSGTSRELADTLAEVRGNRGPRRPSRRFTAPSRRGAQK